MQKNHSSDPSVKKILLDLIIQLYINEVTEEKNHTIIPPVKRHLNTKLAHRFQISHRSEIKYLIN